MADNIRLGDVVVKRDSGSTAGNSSSSSSSSGGSGIKLSSQDIQYLKKFATTSTKSKRIVKNKQYSVTVKEQIKLPRRTKPESIKREYKTWAKTQQGAVSNIRNAGIKGQIVSVKQVKK